MYDFAMIGDIRSVFSGPASSYSVSLLISNHDGVNGSYEDARGLGASVDNYGEAFLDLVHDSTAKPRLKLALAFLFSVERVPLVYTGNEYGMKQTLPGDLFRPGNDEAFKQWFGKLVQVRNAHAGSLVEGTSGG